MPLQIVRNDITKIKADAIVNPANPLPTVGAGIDTAVYEAAGWEKLLSARRLIGKITPGASVLTDGYNLPATYIIHTVGTFWQGGDAGEEEIIRNCYRSVFSIVQEKGIETLAIPLLASGSYHFPKGIALRIALSEIEAFLQDHDTQILLVVFDPKSFQLTSELYGDIDAYINDNYVEEKFEEEYGSVEEPADEPLEEDLPEPQESRKRMSFFGAATAAGSNALGRGSLFQSSKKSAREAFEQREEAEDFAPDFVGMSAAMAMPQADEEKMSINMLADKACVRSLDDVIENLDKTFMELVFSFADAKGISDVEVQKRANLDRKAFSKLKCGTTKNPSKTTALALAIALKLNLDETKDLLSRAGLALSPCSRQDLIVQYFIEREAYDIHEINIALFEHGEEALGART